MARRRAIPRLKAIGAGCGFDSFLPGSSFEEHLWNRAWRLAVARQATSATSAVKRLDIEPLRRWNLCEPGLRVHSACRYARESFRCASGLSPCRLLMRT